MNKIITACIILLTASACKYDNAEKNAAAYNIKINFTHRVNGSVFVPNTTYSNAFGELYTLQKFNYYFTNIELLRNGSGVGATETDSYHLVKAEETPLGSFTITVPKTSLNGISFLIGVDSARNVSGAQTGALDPLNGMFWTWNTGYIMVKMEGSSPLSTNSGNRVEWHVGGFKEPFNNTRRITLPFPVGKQISINEGGTAEIFINCDIDKWFNGQHDFKIAANPFSIHSTIPVTKDLADNYATMFTITDVINR